MSDDTSKGISSTALLAVGIIGGLLGIYLSSFDSIFGPILGCLGAVCAIVWGADAIRRVAGYGLGTGVPSIGYMSLAIGIIGSMIGIGIVAVSSSLKGLSMIGPVLALVLSMVLGLIVAVLAKKVIGMKIPVLERCTAEIAGAAALSVLGFSTAIAGGFDFAAILKSVVVPGYIAVFFILNTMAIQHPFNACLGPNEDQMRTFKCALSTAFLSMTITGILALSAGGIAWFVILIVGLIGWIVSFRSFVEASYEGAASVKWSGLWPKLDDQ